MLTEKRKQKCRRMDIREMISDFAAGPAFSFGLHSGFVAVFAGILGGA